MSELIGSGGGFRDITATTSGTVRYIDLSALAGCVIELYSDQALYFSWAPAGTTSGYALDVVPSAVTASAGTPAVGTVANPTKLVPRRLAATTYIPQMVRSANPVLVVKAQSTSTTYIEGVVISDKQPGL